MLKELRILLNLAWPVITSRIGILTLQVVDTIMVGQYAASHLAYLGVGVVLPNIVLVVMIGLLMGTSVLVSRAYGAGDLKHTGEIWLMSLTWSFLMGLLCLVICAFGEPFLLLAGQSPELAASAGVVSLVAGIGMPFVGIHMATAFFLEAIRRPRPVMVVIIIANIVNVFANYALVYGVWGFPELGAIGSIWATTIIRTLMAVLLVVYVFTLFDFRAHGINMKSAWQWLTKWRTTRDYRHLGYATGLSIGLENIAFNILVLFAGILGLVVAAANTINFAVYVSFYMMGLGLSVATSVSVGNAYGAGDGYMVRRWVVVGLTAIIVASAPFVVLMLVVAGELVRAFSPDPEVIRLAAAMVAYASGALLFDAGQSCLAMSLRARGDNWWPTFSHIFVYCVLMLPGTYLSIFYFERGALGLIDGFYLGTAFPFFILLGRYYILNRRDMRIEIKNAVQ